MKQLLGCLALVGAMTSLSTAQAEFVIDNFVSASDTGFADTTRSAITRIGTVPIPPSGSLLLTTGSVGATGAFDLNFVSNTTGILNAGVLGYNHFLQLSGLNVSADWSLQITASDGVGGAQDGVLTVLLTDGTAGTQIIDLTGLSDVGNLNNLSTLSFLATSLSTVGDGAGGQVATLSIGSIAAVPEPTSIALLGLTGLGGIVVARRRRKVAEVA